MQEYKCKSCDGDLVIKTARLAIEEAYSVYLKPIYEITAKPFKVTYCDNCNEYVSSEKLGVKYVFN